MRAVVELAAGLLVGATLARRLEREETASGARFWRRIALSVVLGAVAAALAGGPATGPWPGIVEMAGLALAVFAVEQRPERGGGAFEERGRLDGWAALALVLLGAVYSTPAVLAVAPATALLAGVLDLALAARLASLAVAARGGRWRVAYAGLALAAAVRAAGRPLDLLPGLSAAIVLLTAWWSRRAGWQVAPTVAAERARPRADAGLLLLAALVPPLAHLVLGVDARDEPERTVLIALTAAATAFLATLTLLDLRSRELARRLAERRLQASESRYRYLVEMDPDALFVLRGRRVLAMNPAARGLLGLVPELRARLREGAATPPPASGVLELALSPSDGAQREVEVLFDDPQAQPRTARVRDVTAARRHEAEAARLRGLALVGELAASIAHEVRNPLAAVVFNLRFVAERYGEALAAPRREAIGRAVEQLQRIVSRVLAYARQEAPRPSVGETGERLALALGEILSVAGTMRPRVAITPAPDGVELTVETSPDPGDSGRLLEALVDRVVAAHGGRCSVDRSVDTLRWRIWAPEPDR